MVQKKPGHGEKTLKVFPGWVVGNESRGLGKDLGWRLE